MNADNCEKYFELIEDLIEGELDARNAERVNSHVFACSHCLKEYKILRREKKVYDHYLFDAEPPHNSWANFQERLAAEKESIAPRPVASADAVRKPLNILSFLRLSPSMTAAVLLLFGLGISLVWSKIAPVEEDRRENLAENDLRNLPAIDVPTKTVDVIDNVPDSVAPPVKNQRLQANNKSLVREKSRAATAEIKQKPISPDKTAPNMPEVNEEMQQAALRLKNLEAEIAGQIEKTEMLLRSFRNAREMENIETFDVEYERLQARRLLDENRRLRRDAESYGITYAEEIFGQVEPYLLEIANLGVKPAPEKVRDIKQRVSSQSIIASLQIYGGGAAQ